MDHMFRMASEFNQDLNDWDLSYVTTIRSMFIGAYAFNGLISDWNTENVTDMTAVFYESFAFNQDISKWNVSSVTKMFDMFKVAQVFNQDIGGWDTSSVTNMDGMFSGASTFNHDLTSWCVTNIAAEPSNFAANSALTEANKPVWGTCPNGTSGGEAPSIGDGSIDSPYQINAFSQLLWISQESSRWDKHYVQTADINASLTQNSNAGSGWSPIGNSSTGFTGGYDGKDFSIENLFINRPNDSEIGMFGFVNNGIVKNIQLWDSNITGDTRVGAIAGALTNSSGQFSGNNVYDGFVLGNTTTGGLIGRLANNSHIHASSYTGTVTGYSSSQNFSGSGTPQNIGGIVGKMQGGSVLRKSFFDGHVFGNQLCWRNGWS